MRNWDINTLIERHSPQLPHGAPISPIRHKPLRRGDISNERLKDAYYTIAKIVSEQGEDYLPIFERLDTELKHYNHKHQMLEKAFGVASGSNLEYKNPEL